MDTWEHQDHEWTGWSFKNLLISASLPGGKHSTLSTLTLFTAWPQCVLCLFGRHSLAQTCIISFTQRAVWSFNQGFYLNMHTFGIVRFPQAVDSREVWILWNCVFACLCLLLRILYLSTLIAQGSFSNRCLSRRMLYCNSVPFYDILMRRRPLLWSPRLNLLQMLFKAQGQSDIVICLL